MKHLIICFIVIQFIFVLLGVSIDGWEYLQNLVANFPKPLFIEEIKSIVQSFDLIDSSNIFQAMLIILQMIISVVKIPILLVVYVFEVITVLFKGVLI